MDISSMLNADSPAPKKRLDQPVEGSAGAAQDDVTNGAIGNAGSIFDQHNESTGHEDFASGAKVDAFQARTDTSPRRTRNNNKPSNIRIENGASSIPYQAQPSPHAPKQSSKLANPPQIAEETRISELDEVMLEPDEHIIPISIPTRIYDQYLQVIDKYTSYHSTLLADLNPDIKTVRAIERMTVELDMVTTHPDLVNESVMEDEVDANGGEFEYSRQSSYKFRVLYRLLDTLRKGCSDGIPTALSDKLQDNTKLKIAVVAWEGKAIQILTRIFLSMNLSFTTLDDGQVHNPEKKDNLDLILVSSTFDEISKVFPVDVIYALDSSFERRGALTKALQGDNIHKAPVLFPWIYASPEHVRACLPVTDNGGLDSLRIFSTILVQTRSDLGQLRGSWDKPQDARMEQAGTIVGEWILDGFEGQFPLPKFEPIELTGLELILKPNNKKRLLDDFYEDGSSSPSKRRRTEDLLDGEISSNNIPTSEEIVALREEVKSLKNSLLLQDNRLQEHSNDIARTRADLLNSEIARKILEEKYNTECKTSLDLMHHCERALREVSRNRSKIANLAIAKETHEVDLQSKSATIERLKVELEESRAKVKEFENSPKRVSSNGIPTALTIEATDLVLLRSESEAQQKEITSLKKKVQSSEDSRNYAFRLYQEASSRAVELSGEVDEKQFEIDRLIPLAENHAEIALQAAADSELATVKLALDRALAEKEELEEQLRRGNTRPGMSTRGQSSAPGSSRSPRVAVSPPPRSRASSRQPVSRATSPTGRGGQAMRRALSGRLAEP